MGNREGMVHLEWWVVVPLPCLCASPDSWRSSMQSCPVKEWIQFFHPSHNILHNHSYNDIPSILLEIIGGKGRALLLISWSMDGTLKQHSVIHGKDEKNEFILLQDRIVCLTVTNQTPMHSSPPCRITRYYKLLTYKKVWPNTELGAWLGWRWSPLPPLPSKLPQSLLNGKGFELTPFKGAICKPGILNLWNKIEGQAFAQCRELRVDSTIGEAATRKTSRNSKPWVDYCEGSLQ